MTPWKIAHPMVPVSDSCSFLRRNSIALRAKSLVKPVCHILNHYPLRVSDETLVRSIRTTDSLQVDLGDITNINKSSAARANLFLGFVEEVNDKIR